MLYNTFMIMNRKPKDMYIQNINDPTVWNIRASLAARVNSVKMTLMGRGLKSIRLRYILIFSNKSEASKAYDYLEDYLPSSKLSFVIKGRIIRFTSTHKWIYV